MKGTWRDGQNGLLQCCEKGNNNKSYKTLIITGNVVN